MWKFLICIELFIVFECPLCEEDNDGGYDIDDNSSTKKTTDSDEAVELNVVNYEVYDDDEIPESHTEEGSDDYYEDYDHDEIPDEGSGDYHEDYDYDEIPELEETEECACVVYYQCDRNGQFITDGESMMDPRNVPQAYEIQQNVKKRSSLNCADKGPNYIECCGRTRQFPVNTCGTSKILSIVGRVVTKYTDRGTEFAKWPWQAAILENNVFICGATLIDNMHVLTVAHCVERFINNTQSATVRLGEWDLQMNSEALNHRDYNVSEIVLHPQYRPKILYNDIAILKLAKDVTFLSHINAVCLPIPDDDFIGQDCIVTGWGTKKYGKEKYSRILKEIRLPIISKEQCEQLLRRTKLSHQFKLHDSFICAGGKKGKDACTGDGGGPLVCLNPDDDTYTLVGLVSWGIGCGSPRVPGVYVNVQMFLKWIKQITGYPIRKYWS